MKAKSFVIGGALVLLLAMAAGVMAGEGRRYIRGSGLSGLGNPCCGWEMACCPVWGTTGGCVHPWYGVRPVRPLGHGGWGLLHHGHSGYIQPGPPTGAITYPYYTLRGPRDFLQRNPTPIGP